MYCDGSCKTCGKEAGPGQHFNKCANCRLICYCSTLCQKQDWKEHKPFCQRATKQHGKKEKSTAAAAAGPAPAPSPPVTAAAGPAPAGPAPAGPAPVQSPPVTAAAGPAGIQVAPPPFEPIPGTYNDPAKRGVALYMSVSGQQGRYVRRFEPSPAQ